ncbi:unnamed protein product [Moneuplotes crassus]|uniref:UNC93-like protein MFSD11 n=1 Tax=Euplotes crassus TaxID=5936 RepID=A0AAD1XCE0_EUPCR|nr:unnamed protein product [Moneuplotes crassus]
MADTRNLCKVIHCGIGFFLVFFSYATCQNIAAQVYDQHGYGSLGFYSISMVYALFSLSSIICPKWIKKWGPIKSMAIGSFCYFIWVSSCILPVLIDNKSIIGYSIWIINLITGGINGMGAAFLWVGMGNYVSKCSNNDNKGFNFGVIWALFACNFIVGNLSAAYILKKTNQTIMFLVLSCTSLLGTFTLMMLRTPLPCDNPEKQFQNSEENEFKALKEEGDDLQERILDDDSLSKEEEPEITFATTFALIRTTKMRKLLTLMIFVAIIIGFKGGLWSKLISNIIEDEEQKLVSSLYCLFFIGIGEVSCALTLARVIDRLGKHSILVLLTLIVTTMTSMFIVHSQQKFGWHWYVVSFLLGANDSFNNTLINSINGSEFENQTEPFACCKFIEGLVVFTVLIFESFIKTNFLGQQVFLIFICAYGVVGCCVCYTFPFKDKKDTTTKHEMIEQELSSSIVQ